MTCGKVMKHEQGKAGGCTGRVCTSQVRGAMQTHEQPSLRWRVHTWVSTGTCVGDVHTPPGGRRPHDACRESTDGALRARSAWRTEAPAPAKEPPLLTAGPPAHHGGDRTPGATVRPWVWGRGTGQEVTQAGVGRGEAGEGTPGEQHLPGRSSWGVEARWRLDLAQEPRGSGTPRNTTQRATAAEMGQSGSSGTEGHGSSPAGRGLRAAEDVAAGMSSCNHLTCEGGSQEGPPTHLTWTRPCHREVRAEAWGHPEGPAGQRAGQRRPGQGEQPWEAGDTVSTELHQ